MAEGDIGSVQGTLEFETGGSAFQKMIHVAGHVYAIAFQKADLHGNIKAVTISDDGATVALAGGSLEFYANQADEIDLIHVTGHVFAIAYQDEAVDGWIKTVTISDDGATIALAGGSLEFDGTQGKTPWLIHIAGNVFAVVYWGPDNDGWLKTVTISNDGSTIASIASLEFDGTYGAYPHIVHVTGNVYAIAYSANGTVSWIKTVTISDDGATLALVGGGSLDLGAGWSAVEEIIHVTGNVFAVIYWDLSNDGWIKAVTISDDGATVALAGGSLEFDGAEGKYSDIIHVSGNAYAIAYTGVGSDGWLRGITISDDGATIALAGGSLEFDGTQGYRPSILYITGSIYAIAYKGTDGDGFIASVEIETVIADGIKYLPLMGMG